MPSTRLLLDGPDLPALLRRAEAVGGQVVKAQRVRRGLLGRRWYEVTVDVPDRPASSPSAAELVAAARFRPRPPAGLDDLLAAAEAAERSEAAAARATRTAKERDGR